MANNGANQYKQMAVKTASRGQILIMLYEAAIRNLKQACLCIDKKDIAGKGTHIGKTHDIVNELTNSLNFDVGGDVARNLERLYSFCTEHLLKANLDRSQDGAKQNLLAVQKVLETLLDGWKVAVQQAGKDPNGPAANPTNNK